MKIMNAQTTLYFAEPFHQVMKKMALHRPALIITTPTLYEYYANTVPVYLAVEVLWYIMPANQKVPTFDQLAEIFQLCQDEELMECTVIGFGPAPVLNLAGVFCGVYKGAEELWQFPQSQEGLIKALNSEQLLSFNGATQNFAVNVTPSLIFFEEGIEPDVTRRLKIRQRDLLFLIMVTLFQNNTALTQLQTTFPTIQPLLKVSQLAFIESELQTLLAKGAEVDELIATVFRFKRAFSQNLQRSDEELLALALLFYLFVCNTSQSFLDMLQFKRWLTQLNLLPHVVALKLSDKMSAILPKEIARLDNFGVLSKETISKKEWHVLLDEFFNFIQ